jgi:FdrA protein
MLIITQVEPFVKYQFVPSIPGPPFGWIASHAVLDFENFGERGTMRAHHEHRSTFGEVGLRMMIQVDGFQDIRDRLAGPKGGVGIVSASLTGLLEVTSLLAREGVGVSRAIVLGRREAPHETDVAAMEAGLCSLLTDPATEIVVLISEKLPEAATTLILDRVRDSDKPTVVCFVGSSPRLAWRAGAIPATRLDEAAMRATAWVRGWDQALVSSKLEEEGDELTELAASLKARIGPERLGIGGVLAGSILRREAQIVLAATTSTTRSASLLRVTRDLVAQMGYLRDLLAASDVAAILLTVWVDVDSAADPVRSVAALIKEARNSGPLAGGKKHGEPLIVAHVCDAKCDVQRLVKQEAGLRQLDVVVAGSNASAARLAGLVVQASE